MNTSICRDCGLSVGHRSDCRALAIPAPPRAGDIGEPLKHTEIEPAEEPLTAPAPEEVPSR